MFEPRSSLKDNWKEVWITPFKRRIMITGTIIMLIVVFVMPFFFGYIEKRRGALLNDWLLAQIPPHNVSGFIFAIIWGMILFAVVRALYNASIYITYCWTLIFVTIARFACIFLVPLNPPVGLIPLTDPITNVFYGNVLITKDLFFSGHTAILTLIVLCLEKKTDKVIGAVAAIAVAFLLLVQHVHYSIDILAAPIIVYALYRATRHFLVKIFRADNAKPEAKVVNMLKEKAPAKVFSERK